MAKKLSFEKLPEAVDNILNILTSEESEHSALPELLRRVTILEKKIDDLQKTISPDMATMDMNTVCRVLGMRPKAVSELEMSGILPSHSEGRKKLFYEADVIKFHINSPVWKAKVEAVSKPVPAKQFTPEDAVVEENRRIDVAEAAEMLGRSSGTIYQLTSKNRIPFHKEGKKVYFLTDELREWAADNLPRKRRK